jgi:hypothetical protein
VLKEDPQPIASFFKRFRNIKSAAAKQQKTQFPKWRYLNSKVKETIVKTKRGALLTHCRRVIWVTVSDRAEF